MNFIQQQGLQRTADFFVGRRGAWDGVVVQDLWRHDEYLGHYWRVSTSWRNPDTGDWDIRWQQRDYLGPVQPKGEPIYVFRGEWDMKAKALTVFPTFWAPTILVLATLIGYGGYRGWTQSTGAFYSGSPTFGIFWIIVCYVIALWTIADIWSIKVEPVRGRKILYASAAAMRYINARDRANRVPFGTPEPWEHQ